MLDHTNCGYPGPHGDAPRSLGSWWSSQVLSVAFVLLAAMAYVGPRAFAPLGALTGLIVLPRWRWDRQGALCAALGAALLAWAILSLLWSVQPVVFGGAYKALEQLTFVKLAALSVLLPSLAVAAGRTEATDAKRTALISAWSLVALSVLIVIDSLNHARLYQAMVQVVGIDTPPDISAVKVSQGSTAVVVLMWPAHVALRRIGVRYGGPVFAAAAIAATLLLGFDVALLATVMGGLVFVLVYWFGRGAVRLWAVMVACYWLLAPAVVLICDRIGLLADLTGRLPPSWDTRLTIWTFAADRIAEHPLRGWGLDASRAFGLQIPLHPHDGALQMWLELGTPGAILTAVLSILIAATIGRRSGCPDASAAAAGSATAFLTIGAVSYGLWQEWWLALGALAAAACVLLFRWREGEQIGPPGRA